MQICCDVSGSMYRFNGYDQRMQRQLEAVMMMMEALDGSKERIRVGYCSTTHYATV